MIYDIRIPKKLNKFCIKSNSSFLIPFSTFQNIRLIYIFVFPRTAHFNIVDGWRNMDFMSNNSINTDSKTSIQRVLLVTFKLRKPAVNFNKVIVCFTLLRNWMITFKFGVISMKVICETLYFDDKKIRK